MSNTEKEQPIVFSRNGVRNVDRDAIDRYGMQGIVLMENAARGSVDVIVDVCNKNELQQIIVVCGAGNNGGDGYAIARHLHNRGCKTSVLSIAPPKTPEAVTNAEIAEKMCIPFVIYRDDLFEDATLIIDAIFGTGINQEVRGPAVPIIASIGQCNAKIVSIDIPSGLDCDTGQPLGMAVKADLTITFAGFKQGFMQNSSACYVGDVVVVDIGCPQELVKKYALPNS
ncbi:MAG: NAD(P)H-hydrate epimerase [Planctomycetes bacterium]|nr:NAD(P)H-hydrate epimerase [Planctomycetota bacterium]